MRNASGVRFAHDPEVHSLFSSAAVRKSSEQSGNKTIAQIETIAAVIDEVLLNMASEGYVCPTAESEIAQMLQEIRSKGRLNAAPWDNQPTLTVKCEIPQVKGLAPLPKVGRGKKTPVAPSKAWAKLGGQEYEFVDRRK